MVTLTPNFLLNPAAPENICSRKNYVNDINYCLGPEVLALTKS